MATLADVLRAQITMALNTYRNHLGRLGIGQFFNIQLGTMTFQHDGLVYQVVANYDFHREQEAPRAELRLRAEARLMVPGTTGFRCLHPDKTFRQDRAHEWTRTSEEILHCRDDMVGLLETLHEVLVHAMVYCAPRAASPSPGVGSGCLGCCHQLVCMLGGEDDGS